MSFILDALKKSEAERNRKTGPVLMDMRIAHPRRRLPVWVWVIAVVLLANLALLGYVLLRGSPADTVSTGAVAAGTVLPATTPPIVVTPPPAGNTAALPDPTLPAAPQAAGGVVMQSNEVVSPGGASGPGTTGQPEAAADPADNALPTDEDLRSGGVSLPELRLSLHVYDNSPGNRFVLLNSSRLLEGQETSDGVRVERITPTGVVLSHRGRRFQMRPGQ
jgi:general secretion pathway protein B